MAEDKLKEKQEWKQEHIIIDVPMSSLDYNDKPWQENIKDEFNKLQAVFGQGQQSYNYLTWFWFFVKYGDFLSTKEASSEIKKTGSVFNFIKQNLGIDTTSGGAYTIGNKLFEDFLKDENSLVVSDISFMRQQAPVIDISKTVSTCHKFLPAMRTKPFLLLAGISGTGKSQIVKEMAFATCPDRDDLRSNEASPGNYCLIEVKPNWHDSTELLGYDSAIKKQYVVTKFVKFVVKAMRYPDVPFFVCLDEMNLAPVEQYFAEFLSVLESRKLVNGCIISEPLIGREAFSNPRVALDLFDLLSQYRNLPIADMKIDDNTLGDNAEIWHTLQEKGLSLPQNLIVIGTVNMDETTHQLSRKVIDRAMTFEMNEANFDNYFEGKVTLDYVVKPLEASSFLAHNVSGKRAIQDIKLDEQFKTKVVERLNELNNALEDTPFKIAYRVQNELVLYFAELLRENAGANQDETLATALDDIMMMKVLPRIEGDDELLGTRSDGTLNKLTQFAAAHNLTNSIAKIEEMLKRLERSHFTSFWP